MFGYCGSVVRLRNLRDLRETLGFLLCILIEYSHVNILPQIAQITQRNAASCIISQRKTVCEVSVVLGFICVNQRDLRETLGFLLCGLFEYSCVYSPADSADHAEECSKLHHIAEKDSFVWLVLFWVCLRKSA